MDSLKAVKCPNCGFVVNIEETLSKSLEAKYKNEFLRAKHEFEKEIKSKRNEYKTHLDALKEKEAKFEENFKATLNKALVEKESLLKSQISKDLKAKFEQENSSKFELLEKELSEKSQKLKNFNAQTAELEKLKRKNEELISEFNIKKEIEISKALANQKATLENALNEKLDLAKKELNESFKEKDNALALKLKEKDILVERLKTQISDLQKRSEQTSQELQGEAQELIIEEFLKANFIYDIVEPISKGIRGADCLQTVISPEFGECGKILYESKRTKEFSDAWIAKFKSDIAETGADIGILVTKTMPKELERLNLKDGVWVCSFDEFKSLSLVLRHSLLSLAYANNKNIDKSTKMALLYDYLTSNEFKIQAENIISTFITLKENLEKEKRAYARIWKEREKQILLAQNSAIAMHSSIRTISGNLVENLEILKLPFEDEILDKNGEISDDENFEE